MQPDTQREGPAYRLGQAPHRTNRGGKGSKYRQGGADKRQTNKTQAKGPNHTGEHNTKGETPKGTIAEASHRQHREPKRAEPERERSNETRTKDGSDNTTKSKPPQKSRKRKGGPQEQEPRQGEKGAPHNHSQWEQVILWRPGEEGKVKQASKPKRGRRTEKRGDRYV